MNSQSPPPPTHMHWLNFHHGSLHQSLVCLVLCVRWIVRCVGWPKLVKVNAALSHFILLLVSWHVFCSKMLVNIKQKTTTKKQKNKNQKNTHIWTVLLSYYFKTTTIQWQCGVHNQPLQTKPQPSNVVYTINHYKPKQTTTNINQSNNKKKPRILRCSWTSVYKTLETSG